MKKILAVLAMVLLLPVTANAVVFVVQMNVADQRPDLNQQEWRRGATGEGDILEIKDDTWTITDPRFGTYECWKYPWAANADSGNSVYTGCVEVRGMTYSEALVFFESSGTYFSDWQFQLWEVQPNNRNELIDQGYTTIQQPNKARGWLCNKTTSLDAAGKACTPRLDIP